MSDLTFRLCCNIIAVIAYDKQELAPCSEADRGRVANEAYIRLSFVPGEAHQFDWSHEIREGGAHAAFPEPYMSRGPIRAKRRRW